MSVSITFIVGLVFNIMIFATNLITTWQNQKLLNKQGFKFVFPDDIEMGGLNRIDAQSSQGEPISSGLTGEGKIVAPLPSKPLRAIVREQESEQDTKSAWDRETSALNSVVADQAPEV